jgi:hypothetical protein
MIYNGIVFFYTMLCIKHELSIPILAIILSKIGLSDVEPGGGANRFFFSVFFLTPYSNKPPF